MALLNGVLGTVNGLLGGLLGGGGSVGGLLSPITGLIGGGIGGGSNDNGNAGGGLGGLLSPILGGNNLLDGLIDIHLLDEQALLNIGILPEDAENGFLRLSLLDKDGDGFIDLELLNKAIDLTLLDTNGSLISLNILDRIKIGVDVDGDGDPDFSADPSDFDVVIIGTNEADREFISSSQSTYYDGRGAIDVASYAASAQGFNLVHGANGVFIVSENKVDYLLDVERVVFSDGTLHLDTGQGEVAGFAYRLYQAAFDRAPDNGGLAYWIDVLESGAKSAVAVADDFLYSVEFQRTYGNLSNQQFIGELYENILDRSGEQSGVNYWVNQLESGARSRAEVLANFAESAENVELVGAQIETGFFLAA